MGEGAWSLPGVLGKEGCRGIGRGVKALGSCLTEEGAQAMELPSWVSISPSDPLASPGRTQALISAPLSSWGNLVFLRCLACRWGTQGWATETRWLVRPLHMAFPRCKCIPPVSHSSYKDTIPMGLGLQSTRAKSTLHHLLKGPSPNTVTLRVRVSVYGLEGRHNSAHNARVCCALCMKEQALM